VGTGQVRVNKKGAMKKTRDRAEQMEGAGEQSVRRGPEPVVKQQTEKGENNKASTAARAILPEEVFFPTPGRRKGVRPEMRGGAFEVPKWGGFSSGKTGSNGDEEKPGRSEQHHPQAASSHHRNDLGNAGGRASKVQRPLDYQEESRGFERAPASQAI